ncbi:MAG: hypothetical protein R2753_13300 [Chitinophagales bacterium]
MGKISYITSIVISIIPIGFVLFRIHQLSIRKDKIRKAIDEYYSEKGFKVSCINLLNISERIKYGVPISIAWFYTYYFGIISGKMEHLRKVDVQNQSKDDFIKYIVFDVSKRKIISIKEIDSYQF